MTDKIYLPHQQRVIAEKQELDDKISKLSAFLNSDSASKVNFDEVQLLNKQLICMIDYSIVLGKRIDLW